MPQLQINQGPQDALLYDNSRSYFTNIGYVRTSNFQQELRDVDSQNAATFGSTVQFVIPKAADLMGPVDLMVDLSDATDGATTGSGGFGGVAANKQVFLGWVEAIGCAMIDKVTFSVGSHDIETITGDQLYITNELMRGDEHRYAKQTILKTGRPLVRSDCGNASSTTASFKSDTNVAYDNHSRLIAAVSDTSGTDSSTLFEGKKLIIPLGLFFTKHPSQYFPLAAIAGCNDVRISVKFRNLKELLIGRGQELIASGCISGAGTPLLSVPPITITKCQLRTHYVHVTGPEASLLMNTEHVRILKLWQPHSIRSLIKNSVYGTSAMSTGKSSSLFSFELPFLHPVQEIIIVIRKVSEMSDSTDLTADPTDDYDLKGACKNYFAFQGGGKDPNIESHSKTTRQAATGALKEAYLKVDGFKLTLNGQERHPSLSASGISRDYLMNRLMPMIHSNTSTSFSDVSVGHVASTVTSTTTGLAPAVGLADALPGIVTNTVTDYNEDNFSALSEMMDRKEIYVYPFALNPEGGSPSGAVNFSKVSHAKLEITGTAFATEQNQSIEYQCDVWGVHYNWLQIKDGRAITSFA